MEPGWEGRRLAIGGGEAGLWASLAGVRIITSAEGGKCRARKDSWPARLGGSLNAVKVCYLQGCWHMHLRFRFPEKGQVRQARYQKLWRLEEVGKEAETREARYGSRARFKSFGQLSGLLAIEQLSLRQSTAIWR